MKSLSGRIWVVEAVSIIRLLAALAFAAIAFQNVSVAIPCALYLIAAISDVLDGYLARRLRVVTFFGRVIDLVSDKSVTIVSLLYAAARGIELFPLALIATREIVMIGMRMVILRGAQLFPTNKVFGGAMASVLWGNTLFLFLMGNAEGAFRVAELVYWLSAVMLVGNLLCRISTNTDRIKSSLGEGSGSDS